VAGLLDRLVPPSNAVQLARLLPTSRLHLLPNAGHLLMSYRDGAAPRLLADFFSSRWLERSTTWKTGLLPDADVLDDAA
jgi:pimeloyl-ACP methyl ester carboxylesterase